jgi:DNA-binding response OmpR family regulator
MEELMQILVIDNTAHTGQRIKSLLGPNSLMLEINQANNLNDGIEMILRKQPGIVILDAGSFGPKGLQSVQKIKSSAISSVLVMFTNYTHSMYKNICMEMGADFFFDKTTEFEQLINLIEINLSKNNLNIKS